MVSPGHGEAPECEAGHQRGDGPLLDEAHGAAGRHHRAERVAEVVCGHPGLCLSGNIHQVEYKSKGYFYHRLDEDRG